VWIPTVVKEVSAEGEVTVECRPKLQILVKHLRGSLRGQSEQVAAVVVVSKANELAEATERVRGTYGDGYQQQAT
jgi:hypothetical protein